MVMETTQGTIEIKLMPKIAPKACENFTKLAENHYYDGTTFHRVVPGFLIQGGDPLSKDPDRALHGTGSPGYSIPPETSDYPHRRGTLAMAKVPRTPLQSMWTK